MLCAKTVTDFAANREVLRAARAGVIEVVDGRLAAIHLRRWAKRASILEIMFVGNRYHACAAGDRCVLYYYQSAKHSNFLSLTYTRSTAQCSFRTIAVALRTLDEIAQLKRSDAIVCDVWNWRISERMLARFGWQPHCPTRWHRHYIKRFYGTYPASHGLFGRGELPEACDDAHIAEALCGAVGPGN